MHCHHCNLALDIPPGARKIVLAGNPNVGKSVFFNAFTGMYVDVSNYPGTTLEISHGRYGQDVVIDTPGVYGISSFNDEERIARDIILDADLVINVVDAVHLERDLFLTQQIIDTGVPVIVALNMVDEARKNGMEIDIDLLSRELGVPVFPTVAVEKKGFKELQEGLNQARPGYIDPWLQDKLEWMTAKVGHQGEALLILEGDPIVAERNGLPPGDLQEEIYRRRRERVNRLVEKVQRETSQGISWSTRLGRWSIRPLTGIPILLLALWGMYEIIGVIIAQDVVGVTEETIMQGFYEPWIRQVIGSIIPEHSALGTILIGEFGILTMTVTYIFGLLLPLVVGFYLVLSIFEDSGYLPRIATLLDRVMTSIGLNGRAVIPMILGFGCVTMATIVTRVLGSDRERRIATFLLAMAIPCSAQMGVIVALLSGLGAKFVILYVLAIFSLLALVGTLLNKLLPGRSTDLLIDLPPMRLPRLSNVVKKTATKSSHFLKEATPLFAIGAFIISIMQITGALEMLQDWLRPLTVGWLSLPKEAATAFIMGFVRRDFGAAGFASMELTALQKLAGLITITIFVPCIASALVIFKERGKQEGLIIWPAVLVIAFLIGGLTAQLFNLMGLAGGYLLFGSMLVLAILLGKFLPQREEA
ncbi:MAG: ferrous iron transport protein B [Bacillota bacterium]|uniref:Ferrous iron transport protein B n=2 Tax=Carboxydocella TaxID=178898 RepID=A0A1T4RTF7_9FIRM|nr:MULTISPECIES: ferrous iron transport protein B [Carboxydocella]AVX20407.1 ferrous iron transport protein B [Carboxydocella thermautotrophica]SKA19156.1 ferrous iron transport protein B [Carboxydocella sporoproducens DSM 16521]